MTLCYGLTAIKISSIIPSIFGQIDHSIRKQIPRFSKMNVLCSSWFRLLFLSFLTSTECVIRNKYSDFVLMVFLVRLITEWYGEHLGMDLKITLDVYLLKSHEENGRPKNVDRLFSGREHSICKLIWDYFMIDPFFHATLRSVFNLMTSFDCILTPAPFIPNFISLVSSCLWVGKLFWMFWRNIIFIRSTFIRIP